MDDRWLQGFLEGSGSFSVIIRKSPNTVGYQTVADFTIKLPRGEAPVLEQIRTFLGAGRLYQNRREAILKIAKLEDARTLVAFLDARPFVSPEKEREFQVWRQCVALLEQGTQHTPAGVLAIAHLRDSIHHKRLWNKKNYCSLRVELDPCHIYEQQHALPQGCRVCWDGGLVHLGEARPAQRLLAGGGHA